MPQEPKKRHSRQRQGKRRASIAFSIPRGIKCSNCGSLMLSHAVCKTCGYYRGREVMKMQETKKEAKTA